MPQINRGQRIVRTQTQSALRGDSGLLPAPAIGQRQAVVTLGQREIRIEPQRQLELGQ